VTCAQLIFRRRGDACAYTAAKVLRRNGTPPICRFVMRTGFDGAMVFRLVARSVARRVNAMFTPGGILDSSPRAFFTARLLPTCCVPELRFCPRRVCWMSGTARAIRYDLAVDLQRARACPSFRRMIALIRSARQRPAALCSLGYKRNWAFRIFARLCLRMQAIYVDLPPALNCAAALVIALNRWLSCDARSTPTPSSRGIKRATRPKP